MAEGGIPVVIMGLGEVGRALARAGIGMVAIGLEPGPRRERFLRSPRYDAMEAFFDASVAGSGDLDIADVV